MASISNCDWSELEDKDLLRLHEEFGNKWSIIAQQIPGRYHNPNVGPRTVLKTIFTPNSERSLED
jgi:hypothetical protein